MVTAEALPEVNLDAPLPNEFGFECIVLRLPAEWRLSEEAFLELCGLNEGWEFETTADGELVIMPGTGFDNTERAHEIAADLVNWKRAAAVAAAVRPGWRICPAACCALPMCRGSARSV